MALVRALAGVHLLVRISHGAIESTQKTLPERVVCGPSLSGSSKLFAPATRRRFSAAYKRRIVREADRCSQPGELGALLRREGLYGSNLSAWRRQHDAGVLSGRGSPKRGRKARPKDARDQRIAELERERRRLRRKLEQAETVIEIQKKVSTLLGISLKSADEGESH